MSWQAPTTRPDVAPAYTIERAVDGVTSTIAPTITDAAGNTSFTDDLTVPATIEGKTVTAVSAGGAHSCAVADGAAYCWGSGSDGRLGDGSATARSVPVAVDATGVLAGKTVTAVSVGSAHSCAVADGAAYCWGWGASGQLGDGSTAFRSVPVAIDISGVLGNRVCAADWLHAEGDRCAPGAAIPVSYTINYTKAGWSPPASAGVTATWTTP